MILALKDGIHNEVLVGLLNTPEYSSIPPNSWLLTWRGSTMQVSSKVSKQLFFPLSNPRRKKTSQGQLFCIHPQSHILIANAYPPRSPHPSHTWYISAPPHTWQSPPYEISPSPSLSATSALCVHRLSWLCLLSALTRSARQIVFSFVKIPRRLTKHSTTIIITNSPL